MDVGIIINPVAGPRRSRPARSRVELAHAALEAARQDGQVRLTDGCGSAAVIADEMIAAGATTVVAWGGDGTINEVASAACRAGVTLGVVPGGSGNGFARGLGLELRPRAALETALTGPERRIDTGEIDSRLFVNLAGVGFDAHVAAVFNQLPTRGALSYFWAGARELLSYRASTYTVRAGDAEVTLDAFLVTVANGPEYGVGAVIAPAARFDDGALDLVCVPPRPVSSLLWQARRLFLGTVDRMPDVRTAVGAAMEIEADRPLVYHVDGEVCEGANRVQVAVRPSSLRVRAPRRSRG